MFNSQIQIINIIFKTLIFSSNKNRHDPKRGQKTISQWLLSAFQILEKPDEQQDKQKI